MDNENIEIITDTGVPFSTILKEIVETINLTKDDTLIKELSLVLTQEMEIIQRQQLKVLKEFRKEDMKDNLVSIKK